MAYKVIILYRLYMPSYVLGTFTEYPCLSASLRVMILLGVKFFYYFSCLYSFLFQKLNPAYIRKLPKEFVIEKSDLR